MSQDSGAEIAVEQDVRPCKHMEEMVSGFVDGSLRGPARWYTQLHVLHCTQCRAAAKNLRVVIGQVSTLRSDGSEGDGRLSAGRREEIERAMDKADGASREKD